MLQVGYGSMLLESLLAVLVIVVVGSLSSLSASGVLNADLSAMAEGATPFTQFSVGVTGLIAQLGLSIYNICMKLFVNGGFVFLTDGLQLIVAILLVALGLMIAFCSGKKLVTAKQETE